MGLLHPTLVLVAGLPKSQVEMVHLTVLLNGLSL